MDIAGFLFMLVIVVAVVKVSLDRRSAKRRRRAEYSD